MGITFVVVRLFPQRLLLIELHWLGLGSSNSSLLEGISENEIMYDVESSFSEYVVSHLARILSCALGIEDASFCVCVSACSRRCAVGNRSLHGGGTAQANRHGGGTVQARDRRIIERTNRKGKSEFNNVPDTWL
jgi:hypothetical protein